MLAKSKLNSFEALVSQALIDLEISHKEFITILKENDKYEKMKENVRNKSEKLEEKQENMKADSINLKKRVYKHVISQKLLNICIIKKIFYPITKNEKDTIRKENQ